MKRNDRQTRTIVLALAAVMMLALGLLVSGCSASTPKTSASAEAGGAPAKKTRQLTLVAYSIPKKAYSKIIPAFQAYWKRKSGEDVKFTESYGGSGAQARAVIDGLDADVVQLAMEPDVGKIAGAGLVAEDWRARAPQNGVPTTSLIVFGVRPSNPKKIADWADISKPGIGVITPDPKSSGGAQWNLLGSWGSVSFDSRDASAYAQVESLYANALVLDKSARDASNTFLKKGIGDVALLWESDALIAKAEGGEFDIVYPKSTILAETAVSVVDKVVDKNGTRDVAEAFVQYLFTPEAQEEFAKAGLRPVLPEVEAEYADKYPKPSGKLFTVADFGGWKTTGKRFFGDTGIYSRIQADVAAKKK